MRRIALADADSATLAVSDEVGAVDLTLDATPCAAARTIDVTRVEVSVETTPAGGQSQRVLTTPTVRVPVSRCNLRIGGLIPGEYDVGILNMQDQTATRKRLRVLADDVSTLLIEAPANRLSGRVTLNGRPLGAATLEFRPKSSPLSAVRGMTDEQGRYSAELEKPGPYLITLRIGAAPAAGQQGAVTVVEGDNTFNWDIKGGSLTVKVSNIDHASRAAVDFSVEQTSPAVIDGRSGFVHSVKADHPDLMKGAYQYPALGFATYTIRASQARADANGKARTSRPVTFTLSEQAPATTVTLMLTENSGLLILTDPGGGGVRGASLYGDGLSASEKEPGTYSMEGIPPGHQLQVRATGFVPTCRTAPDNSATRVVLDRGRAVEAEFPGLDSAAASPAGVISWVGADCRVALDAFAYSKLPPAADGTPRFLVANFPSVVEVNHSTGWSDPARTLPVLGGRLLVVPVKGRQEPAGFSPPGSPSRRVQNR
jgi:hypothetical protein